MKNLLLIGCGGHARALIDIIKASDNWTLSGLIGKESEVGSTVLGYPVIGTDSDLPSLRKDIEYAFVGIGQLPSPDVRQTLADQLKDLTYIIPNLISPYAAVSSFATLGYGISIGHFTVVNAAAKIGNFSTLNTRSLIEHDSVIGNHCHVSTGAIINGGCSIGDGSFIGSGSIIRDGISLPSATVISAGKRVMGWPLL